METMTPFPGSLRSASCTSRQKEQVSSSMSSPYYSQWNSSSGNSSSSGSSSSCSPIGSKGNYNTKPERGSDFHHRSPSDTFFMEGQLSWLDDLLNEPDNTQLVPKGHRRAASDTFAYVGANTQAIDTWEDLSYQKVLVSNNNNSIWARDVVNFKGSNETKLDKKPSSFEDKNKKDSNVGVSGSVERHEMEESHSQITEGSEEGASSSSQAKPSVPKAEARRNKQQSAHRSRVRKLQYIAHLERTVQALQSTGTKMSAELEFLDNQNMILNMENRALKQHLDSVSREQHIKQLEHDMLERELGRLQTVCRLQEQEQMLMHHQQQQQQQNPRNRRPKSKDPSTFRGQVNSQLQT